MALRLRARVHGRGCGFERAAFHLEIGLDVSLERLEVGMAQEILDGDGRHARLDEVHRLGVSEGMRADPRPAERRDILSGELTVPVKEKADPRAGHLLATIV